MNAQLPFSSATLSARRWPHVRFSSISLTTFFAARWLSIAFVSRRRSAISLRIASAAVFDLRGARRTPRASARGAQCRRWRARWRRAACRRRARARRSTRRCARPSGRPGGVSLSAAAGDLHRAREHDVHRRALRRPCAKTMSPALKALLGQPRGERLAVLVGQPLEERDLGEEVGGRIAVDARAGAARGARPESGRDRRTRAWHEWRRAPANAPPTPRSPNLSRSATASAREPRLARAHDQHDSASDGTLSDDELRWIEMRAAARLRGRRELRQPRRARRPGMAG